VAAVSSWKGNLKKDSLSKKQRPNSGDVLFDMKTQCVGDEYGQEPRTNFL
jgi:hypothetical protein